MVSLRLTSRGSANQLLTVLMSSVPLKFRWIRGMISEDSSAANSIGPVAEPGCRFFNSAISVAN